MKSPYLKHNLVGLTILFIWLIIDFTNVLAFPIFFSMILYDDYPGIGPLLSRIVFYLPIVIAILLLTILSARIIKDRKYFLLHFPIQLGIALFISLIDFRSWWTDDLFWFAGLIVIQGVGMLIGWLCEKRQKTQACVENSAKTANRKALITRILWALLAFDLLSWIVTGLIGIFATGHSF